MPPSGPGEVPGLAGASGSRGAGPKRWSGTGFGEVSGRWQEAGTAPRRGSGVCDPSPRSDGPWLGGASKRRCRRRRGRCRRLLVGWQGEPVRHHRVVRTHVGEHRGQGAAGHQVGEAEPHAPEVRLGHPLVSGGLGSEVVGCWQAGAWASSCSAWPGSPQVIGDQPGVETARVVRLASGASTVRRPACSRSSSHARRALCPYLSAAVGRYPVAWQQSAGRGLCRSPAALAARGGSRTIGSSLTSVP